MAGLAGSGVHDVPRVLLGRVPLRRGHVLADGEAARAPRSSCARRAAVLSSERALRTSATMTVRENLTLPELAPAVAWRAAAAARGEAPSRAT